MDVVGQQELTQTSDQTHITSMGIGEEFAPTRSCLKRGLLAVASRTSCIDSTSASGSRKLKRDQSKNCITLRAAQQPNP